MDKNILYEFGGFLLMNLANCIAALSQISVSLSVEKLDFERCWLGCF